MGDRDRKGPGPVSRVGFSRVPIESPTREIVDYFRLDDMDKSTLTSIKTRKTSARFLGSTATFSGFPGFTRPFPRTRTTTRDGRMSGCSSTNVTLTDLETGPSRTSWPRRCLPVPFDTVSLSDSPLPGTSHRTASGSRRSRAGPARSERLGGRDRKAPPVCPGCQHRFDRSRERTHRGLTNVDRRSFQPGRPAAGVQPQRPVPRAGCRERPPDRDRRPPRPPRGNPRGRYQPRRGPRRLGGRRRGRLPLGGGERVASWRCSRRRPTRSRPWPSARTVAAWRYGRPRVGCECGDSSERRPAIGSRSSRRRPGIRRRSGRLPGLGNVGAGLRLRGPARRLRRRGWDDLATGHGERADRADASSPNRARPP